MDSMVGIDRPVEKHGGKVLEQSNSGGETKRKGVNTRINGDRISYSPMPFWHVV